MRVPQKRGKSVRYQKNPKSQYFKYLNPYSNDELKRNRARTLSSETDLRYKQSLESKKQKFPKHKWELKEEIIEKETKTTKSKRKKKK